MQALKRRGVAYAVGQLMSFASVSYTMFHAVSLEQIAQADREIHVRLGTDSRGSVPWAWRRVATGSSFARGP